MNGLYLIFLGILFQASPNYELPENLIFVTRHQYAMYHHNTATLFQYGVVDGKPGPEAIRGEAVFIEAGCSECHPEPCYTDLKIHQMGTQGPYDQQNSWDTPTPVEAWRTAPCLHDGKCASLKEVFTEELHGLKKALPEKQVDQQVPFVLYL